MADEACMLVTAAHELEHLRQEVRCAGILDVGNIAIDFVERRRDLFPALTALHVPVNAQAERAGARVGEELLGAARVRRYYESSRPDLLDLIYHQAHSPDAAADLRGFFEANWTPFEEWVSATNINHRTQVERFLRSPCQTRTW
jgi:hypothetical protein